MCVCVCVCVYKFFIQYAGLYTLWCGRFWGAFFCRTYRGGFPSSLIAPHLWRRSNQFTQGAVQDTGSVRLVQLISHSLKNQTQCN